MTLRINLNALEGLYNTEAARLREMLSSRITKDDELIINSDEERSQSINLERAYTRMETIIINAARLPRVRRPTKPSPAVREERLRAKRIRSKRKAERRFSHDD